MDELIYETDFWKVVLIDDQTYLGRSVVVLKRDCGEMSGLDSQEVLDFHTNVVQKMENVFKKTFNATMFNWTCLMNNAYKAENPEPHVHWHFRPRYRNDVQFAGETFQDVNFAHHYDRAKKKIVSKVILELIAKEIRNNL